MSSDDDDDAIARYSAELTAEAELARAALVAMAGGIVRARWGAIASMVSAATLGFAMLEISGLTIRLTDAGPILVTFMVLLATGCIAAVIASVLGWRSARSTFGTLRGALN